MICSSKDKEEREKNTRYEDKNEAGWVCEKKSSFCSSSSEQKSR